MFNPALIPAGMHNLPFKYVEVLLDEETGAWLALIYARNAYEISTPDCPAKFCDTFSAIDEVTVLSRARKEHPMLVIAKTAGEIKFLPA